MIEDMTGGCKLFFFASLLVCTSIIHATPRDIDGKMISPWSLELQNKLDTLNKRHVKSVEIPNGDIIDCVNIYEQPAFDHPLLKHHKIQMRPSDYPKDFVNYNNNATKITQLWDLNENCPKGTIPIRRTKIADLLRAESIKRFGTKTKLIVRHLNTSKLDNDPRQGHEYAITYLDAQLGARYYGAKATMNVWNSKVQENHEYSMAEMIVLGGPVDKDVNAIEAGWQVNPTLFGDRKPRVFIYWTSDGYKSTGCFNHLCPGFIQVDRSSTIGGELRPLSKYGDRTHQYDIILVIFQDRKTGNWWLKYGAGEGHVIGYWPNSLFTYLANGANTIEWGGDVINLKVGGQHTTTQMGSGHFSGEGSGKASFFRNVKYVDDTNNLVDPVGWSTYTSDGTSNCYDIKKFDKGGNYEYHFFYGGPGRNKKCP